MELLGIVGAAASWILLLAAPIALALALVESAALPSRRPPFAPDDADASGTGGTVTRRDAPGAASLGGIRPAADGCACAG